MKRFSMGCVLLLMSFFSMAAVVNEDYCPTGNLVVDGWVKVVSNGSVLLVIDYTNDYGQFRNAYTFPLEEGSLLIESNVPEFAIVERFDNKHTANIVPVMGNWDIHFESFCVTSVDKLPFKEE